MKEEAVFEYLFEVAKQSKDPRGVVAACLVKNGEVMLAMPSGDDGVHHAEDLLLRKANEQGVEMSEDVILYCTLEPCSQRTKPGMIDCATHIIQAGVRSIVYGASDPDNSKITQQKFADGGVHVRQTENVQIIRTCAELFNVTVAPEHIGVDVKLKPLE